MNGPLCIFKFDLPDLQKYMYDYSMEKSTLWLTSTCLTKAQSGENEHTLASSLDKAKTMLTELVNVKIN